MNREQIAIAELVALNQKVIEEVEQEKPGMLPILGAGIGLRVKLAIATGDYLKELEK
jgi:hypothetical protein